MTCIKKATVSMASGACPAPTGTLIGEMILAAISGIEPGVWSQPGSRRLSPQCQPDRKKLATTTAVAADAPPRAPRSRGSGRARA